MESLLDFLHNLLLSRTMITEYIRGICARQLDMGGGRRVTTESELDHFLPCFHNCVEMNAGFVSLPYPI